MPPEPHRFAARLKAARTAVGVDQKELEQRFERDGYRKSMVGQLERQEVDEIRGIHLAAVGKALGFPEAWFTAEDPTALFARDEAVSPGRLEVLESQLEGLLQMLESQEPAQIAQLRAHADDVRRQFQPSTRPHEEPGSEAGNG